MNVCQGIRGLLFTFGYCSVGCLMQTVYGPLIGVSNDNLQTGMTIIELNRLHHIGTISSYGAGVKVRITHFILPK